MNELTVEEFMKPKCPVKVGDQFYRRYHVPSTLNPIVVEAVEERCDKDGPFYAITGRAMNTAVGIATRIYDSRGITDENYVIIRKGKGS